LELQPAKTGSASKTFWQKYYAIYTLKYEIYFIRIFYSICQKERERDCNWNYM